MKGFEPTIVSVKYALGGIRVFTKELDVLEFKEHFSRVRGGRPALPLESELRAHDGVLFRSFPNAVPLKTISRSERFIEYVPHQYQQLFIRGEGSFEQYLSKFSSKTRWSLRRKVKRFLAGVEGSNVFNVYSGVDGMEAFYPLARDLSRKTYQEKLLGAGLPESETFRSKMMALAAEDRCTGYLLSDADRPVAYLYTSRLENDIHLYNYLGYDPKYANLSPGTVLQYKVLEFLFSRGSFLFDLTEGEGAHKKLFATDSCGCADIYLLKHGFTNYCFVYSHRVFSAFANVLGSVMSKLQLKAKVKRVVRKLAGV